MTFEIYYIILHYNLIMNIVCPNSVIILGPAVIKVSYMDRVKIYKFNNETSLSVIQHEFDIYMEMQKVSSAFVSFDKLLMCVTVNDLIYIPFDDVYIELNSYCDDTEICLNTDDKDNNTYVLIGNYDEKYTDFSEFTIQYVNFSNAISSLEFVNNIHALCIFIDNEMRANNFVHGDLKSDNILFNTKTKTFRLIDLEFSTIISGDTITVNRDENLHCSHYLKCYAEYSKEYMFLLDITVLTFTLLYQTRCNWKRMYSLLIDIYKSNRIKSKSFLDMLVIMHVLHKLDFNSSTFKFNENKHTLLTEKGCMDSSVININFIFSQTLNKSMDGVDDFLIQHLKSLNDIINNNMYINMVRLGLTPDDPLLSGFKLNTPFNKISEKDILNLDFSVSESSDLEYSDSPQNIEKNIT